jgi:NadR type nicotinamide-nucleotide adenylyltransferase
VPPALVLGKFLPPHRGHQLLFDVAAGASDDLHIVVEHIAGEPIPSALRARWVAELCPAATVHHLDRPMPQEPSQHAQFWTIWREALLGLLPAAPDRVFASEPYGARLAQELGARFIPVDLARAALPVSGTAVRADPLGRWADLSPPARGWYARRICVVGPESTGKSTLVAQLAEALGALAVPEHARALLEQPGALDRPWPAVLDDIARGQRALEEAHARACPGLLVCDTDLLTTRLWSEALTGACAPWIAAAAAEARYALTLLCAVDLPWVPDPVRYKPDDRAPFFARFEAALREAGRPTAVVRGQGPDRLACALRALDAAGIHPRAAARPPV